MGKVLKARIAKIEEKNIKEKNNKEKNYEGITWLEYVNGQGKRYASSKVYTK